MGPYEMKSMCWCRQSTHYEGRPWHRERKRLNKRCVERGRTSLQRTGQAAGQPKQLALGLGTNLRRMMVRVAKCARHRARWLTKESGPETAETQDERAIRSRGFRTNSLKNSRCFSSDRISASRRANLVVRAQGFLSIRSLCLQDPRPARTPAEQAEEHIRPPDQDIGSTNNNISMLCGPAHAIPSEGPVDSPPRGSIYLTQETTHNNHHRKVNTGIGDPPSQDSIRRERLAERQTLQVNRDNMQAAYDARSIDPDDDDPRWGSLSPREVLVFEDCLFWYDTKIAELDALLIPGPQISMPLISRLSIRPPDRDDVPNAEGYQTPKDTRH